MAYSPLVNAFEPSAIHSVGSNADVAASQGASGGNMGMVTSGAISGLTSIATGLINAQRTKNVYKFNAGMAQLQGRVARLQADVEIKRIRQDARSLLSSQRAAYAKSGVMLTGSPLEIMIQSMKDAELDIIFTNINADLATTGYNIQAGLYKSAAKSAQMDSFVDVGKTILQMGTKQYLRG